MADLTIQPCVIDGKLVREKGFEALAAFCQTKTVVLRVQR